MASSFRVTLNSGTRSQGSCKKMMKAAIVTLSLFVAVTLATPYRDCGSTAALTALRVPGCATQQPCIVFRGTNVSIEFDFTATDPTNTLKTVVTGTFGGVTLPWPGTFPPACDTLAVGDCPIQVSEFVTQRSELVLSEAFPSVEALARWKLLDDNDNVVVCFETEVLLV